MKIEKGRDNIITCHSSNHRTQLMILFLKQFSALETISICCLNKAHGNKFGMQ